MSVQKATTGVDCHSLLQCYLKQSTHDQARQAVFLSCSSRLFQSHSCLTPGNQRCLNTPLHVLHAPDSGKMIRAHSRYSSAPRLKQTHSWCSLNRLCPASIAVLSRRIFLNHHDCLRFVQVIEIIEQTHPRCSNIMAQLGHIGRKWH